MSENTPSQAEGEPDTEGEGTSSAQDAEHPQAPRTTPSQAEGDRGDEDDDQTS
jgi:hypothetical protein